MLPVSIYFWLKIIYEFVSVIAIVIMGGYLVFVLCKKKIKKNKQNRDKKNRNKNQR